MLSSWALSLAALLSREEAILPLQACLGELRVLFEVYLTFQTCKNSYIVHMKHTNLVCTSVKTRV